MDETVFRIENAALYFFSWLREVYGQYWLWYLPKGVREALKGCSAVLEAVLGNEFN